MLVISCINESSIEIYIVMVIYIRSVYVGVKWSKVLTVSVIVFRFYIIQLTKVFTSKQKSIISHDLAYLVPQ